MKVSLHDALAAGAAGSPEHKALARAISKARGDRALAIKHVLRLYGMKDFDALPPHVRAAVRGML